MRIFNPFKPHICEFGTGGFAVRAFRNFGWAYLDRDAHTWWYAQSNAVYALFTTPEFAAQRIVEYYKHKPFSKLYAY